MGWLDRLLGRGGKGETPTTGGVKVIKNQVTLQFHRANVDTANMTDLVNSATAALNQLRQNKEIDSFTVDRNQQRGGQPVLLLSVSTDSSRQNAVIAAMKKLEFEGPDQL